MQQWIGLRFLLWLSCFGIAHAWDGDGHERIGHIARHVLGKDQKNRIENMIKDSSNTWSNLLGLAAWEAHTNQKYPGTAKLHYHKQTPEWGCRGRIGMDIPGSVDGTLYCNDASAAFNSLFCAMMHFWQKIQNEGAPTNLTAKIMLKHGTINSLYDLNEQDVYTIPASFRWFIILLADVHQPLHWLRADSVYGKDVKVDFKGSRMSLLEVWESHILKYPDWKNEDWKGIRSEYDQLVASSWNFTHPTDLLQQWSQDVAKRVCPDIYGMLGEPDENGVHVLDSQTVLKWIRMGRELAILAGQHIAHLLQFMHRQVHVRRLIISKQYAEIDRKMNTTTTTFQWLKESETFEPPDYGAIDFMRILDHKDLVEDFAEVDYSRPFDVNPTKDDKTYDYDKFKNDQPQLPMDLENTHQKEDVADWEHPENIHPRVEV